MTQLRHRKLVQLLGYCQVRGELVLVYDYMTNGSQDEHLYGGDRPAAGLSWERCGRILQDVLAELFCLHEGWEQVLVHELGRLPLEPSCSRWRAAGGTWCSTDWTPTCTWCSGFIKRPL